MKLSVYSIQNTLFDGECEKVIARTPEGEITILAHHIPLVTRLVGPGIDVIDNKGGRVHIKITSGVLEVRPGSEVVLLAS